MTLREYDRLVARARKRQAKQVMPLIGPLLDAWEEVPNDLRGLLQEQAMMLGEYLDRVEEAMCVDLGDEGEASNNG